MPEPPRLGVEDPLCEGRNLAVGSHKIAGAMVALAAAGEELRRAGPMGARLASVLDVDAVLAERPGVSVGGGGGEVGGGGSIRIADEAEFPSLGAGAGRGGRGGREGGGGRGGGGRGGGRGGGVKREYEERGNGGGGRKNNNIGNTRDGGTGSGKRRALPPPDL